MCGPSPRQSRITRWPCQHLRTARLSGHIEPQMDFPDEAAASTPVNLSLFLPTPPLPLLCPYLLVTFLHSFFVSLPSYPLLSPYLRGQQSLQPIWHWLTGLCLSWGRSIVTNIAHGSYIKRIRHGCKPNIHIYLHLVYAYMLYKTYIFDEL